jgi:hypothetical protein
METNGSQKVAAHAEKTRDEVEAKSRKGISEIEGKAARAAAKERRQGLSFKPGNGIFVEGQTAS